MSNHVITLSACNNTLSMYFDARCVSLNTHCVFLHMVIFWVIYIGLQRLVKTELCICLQPNNWGISGRYKKDKFQVEVSGLLRWLLGHPLSSLHSYSMHHQGRVSIEFWFSFTIFCILFRAFARHVNRRRYCRYICVTKLAAPGKEYVRERGCIVQVLKEYLSNKTK